MLKLEGVKPDTLKNGVFEAIKFSESVALEAINSATTVARAGLESVESIADKSRDVILNTTLKTISAGNIVANDVRNVTTAMVKETIQSVSNLTKGMRESGYTKVNITSTSEKPEGE